MSEQGPPEVPKYQKRAPKRKWHAVELRVKPKGRGFFGFFAKWTVVSRYRTEAQARQAVDDLMKRRHCERWQYRYKEPSDA